MTAIYPYIDGNLDYVIATHPDADHIGGLPAIFTDYTIDYVIDSGTSSTSAAYSKYEKSLQIEGAELINDADMTISLGDAVLKIIETGDNSGNNNADSVVCELIYNNTSILFTGDMPEDIERANLGKFEDIDILKVGHHGSRTSTCADFLLITWHYKGTGTKRCKMAVFATL